MSLHAPLSPNKKIILFYGPNDPDTPLAATIAGSHLNHHGVSFVNTTSHSAFQAAINGAFGLKHGPAVYADKMDQDAPDFFGHSPRSVYLNLAQHFESHFGDNFIGRTLGRRIRFNPDKVTIISDWVGVSNARALVHEVGPKNVLIISISDRLTFDQPHDTFFFKEVQQQFYPNALDRLMLRTVVQTMVRDFVGIAA